MNNELEIDPEDVDRAIANLTEIRRLLDINKRLLQIGKECAFEEIVRDITEELESLRGLERTVLRFVKPRACS